MFFAGNVFAIQNLIVLVLGLAAFATEVYAFVDALRHRSDAYVAAGKLTKQLWLIILGVAMAVGFVVFWNPLGFIGIIAFVAAAVYLADVRPALRSASGRGGSRVEHGPVRSLVGPPPSPGRSRGERAGRRPDRPDRGPAGRQR